MNKKQTAKHFLELCAKGDSRRAFELYAAPNLKHHNAYFKGDAETIIKAMEESAKENPNTVIEFKHVLEDGNLVAVHSYVKHNADHPGYAVMHIFRCEGDRFAEMWDFGQEVPSEMINENGMF